METNWAAEHLQTIRTLMERSAIYRRALAPIMIVTGSIGLLGSILSCFVTVATDRAFSIYWMLFSLAGFASAFWLARRQALKEGDAFWSPPTRRVLQALLPGFLVGLVAGSVIAVFDRPAVSVAWLLALLWIVFYGCALHAAGFFMQRGIKLFAWLFILGGCSVFGAAFVWPEPLRSAEAGHYLMGIFFGALHLAYGIYLYFSEKRRALL